MTPSNTSQKQTGTAENIFAIEDSKDFGVMIAQKVRDLTLSNQGTAFALHYCNVGIAYAHVYGLDVEGVGANAAVITRSGDQGSIAEMRIPAAAGMLTKVWNLVVGPELSWTAVASSTDAASDAEAIVAKSALEYYLVDKNIATMAKAQAFESMAFGEAALHVPWDEETGADAGVDPGDPSQGIAPSIVKQGDIAAHAVSTWDIIRDPTARSKKSLQWVIVRDWQNRFDVSARAKDPDTKAAALTTQAQLNTSIWRPFNQGSAVMSDLIPVYYLYHKKTAAKPDGRQTVFLETGDILEDQPLDKAYHEYWPVAWMQAGEYSGTPFPYSKFFGITGAGQAADSLARDLLTNATSTSGGIIWSENDAETSPIQLGGGPKLLVGAPGQKPPVPIQLQQSHPEHFQLLKTLQGFMQQILGLDALTAGEDVGAQWSGAMAALVTSTSVQNNSQLQAAWAEFMQDTGNIVLKHIQHHMKEPRLIALAGKARAGLVQTMMLSGDKVQGVNRLQVRLSPAFQQTDAGKMQMAEMALKQGWARVPEEVQQVFDSGRLDAMTQDMSNEFALIASENEALSDGGAVPVMLGDDHILHIKGHRAVTASITARKDPKVVQALQQHENEHIQLLKTTDPAILKMFNQPSLAPQGGPPPPSDATKLGMANLAVKSGWAPTPQQAEAVYQSGKLDAGQQAPPAPVPGTPAPQQTARPQGPRMPINPASGQPAAPAAGVRPPALAVTPS